MMGTVRYTVVDGELLAENRNGIRSLYVPDPLGSTVALLNSTQTPTDTFTYWPYGENRTRTGTTPTPFQFVGTVGYYQDSTSMTYVRARYLNTQQGRWQTQDPTGYSAGTNLYAYIQNNPITMLDPQGLQSVIQKINIDLRHVDTKGMGRCIVTRVKKGGTQFGQDCLKGFEDCLKDPASWLQALIDCWAAIVDPALFAKCVAGKKLKDCIKECLKEDGKELIQITYNCLRDNIHNAPKPPALPPMDKWPKLPSVINIPPGFKLRPKLPPHRLPGMGPITCNDVPGTSKG